jgi:hypothetical protein
LIILIGVIRFTFCPQRVEIIILAEENNPDSPLEELRQKIERATEQILAGNVTEGELVFEQLQARFGH